MDDSTREAVGRLGRWTLLLLALAGAAGVLLLTVGAFGTTRAAAKAWAVAVDGLDGTRYNPRARLYSQPVYDQPGTPASLDLFYTRPAGGPLHRAWYDEAGTAILDFPYSRQPTIVPFAAVPNPYSGYAPAGKGGTIYVLLRRTQVLVIDARCLLGESPDGRLPTSARRDRAARSTLIARAGKPLAYLLGAPLADYEQARALLRDDPAGPVLPASLRHTQPASVGEMVDAINRISGRVEQSPLLITEDAALAAKAAEKAKVVLISHDPPPGLPTTVVVVSRWPDLPAWLALQAGR